MSDIGHYMSLIVSRDVSHQITPKLFCNFTVNNIQS